MISCRIIGRRDKMSEGTKSTDYIQHITLLFLLRSDPAAGGGGGSNRTQDHLPPGSTGSGPNSNNMFHPLAHLGFNSLGGLMNSRHLHSPISNETTSLG